MSPESESILNLLAQHQIPNLFHWTSVHNVRGIALRGAILSKKNLEENGDLRDVETGGDSLSHNLDLSLGNWKYVSLNFTCRTPMLYHKKREKHFCFFEIDPTIATQPGVLFTDTNAASTSRSISPGLAGLKMVRLDIMNLPPRGGDYRNWIQPVQAETLVPERVPIEFVKRIVVVSDASRDEVLRRLDGLAHPPVEIDENRFTDMPGPGSTVNFPMLKQIKVANPSHYDTPFEAIPENPEIRCSDGGVVIKLICKANNGTEVTLSLGDKDQVVRRIRFNSWDVFETKFRAPVSMFVPGRIRFRIWLDQVLWTENTFLLRK